MALNRKAQIHPIGAKDSGAVEQSVDEVKEVVDQGMLVEEVEDQVEDEEEKLDQPGLTHWHAIEVQGAWPFGP